MRRIVLGQRCNIEVVRGFGFGLVEVQRADPWTIGPRSHLAGTLQVTGWHALRITGLLYIAHPLDRGDALRCVERGFGGIWRKHVDAKLADDAIPVPGERFRRPAAN